MKRKIKYFTIGIIFSVISFISLGFVDGFFEISKNLEIFSNIYRELNIYYVDETNPGEMMKAGIDGMLNSLDPYTNYIPESDIEDYRFMTTGQYGGIGALISSKDSLIIISEPYENAPSQKAGLMAGDIILSINGKPTTGKKTSEISKILKGEPGTSLSMEISRPFSNEKKTVTLIREKIKINDVPYFGMINDKVGYVKLTSFTETAAKEVKDAFLNLKQEKGMTHFILDLRGNGGGLLNQAIEIVNLFVDKGQEVVFTKGKVKEWDMSHKTINTPLDKEIPVVVLIDGGSASASEIVSGTLQDLDRAVVIGTNSFGKGLVQQTKDMGYNSKLKLTVAKYYTPSGRCIQRLDYSHKDEEGSVHEVPDSLIKEFKTKNGRPVYDGAGIKPDILVEFQMPAKITRSLVEKNLIFDYATYFRNKNETIVSAKEFEITDNIYSDFTNFIADKDYSYITKTEDFISKIENVSKNEKYYDKIQKELELLNQKVKEEKKEDVFEFKSEIKQILMNEIVSRYYYQTGRIEVYLKEDKDVLKALDIFNENNTYASILKGDYQSK
jgi:carboxyl-terminal processing protease